MLAWACILNDGDDEDDGEDDEEDEDDNEEDEDDDTAASWGKDEATSESPKNKNKKGKIFSVIINIIEIILRETL